jgi:anti-sigma regulatory factor (Ser/Thr protein kinase)
MPDMATLLYLVFDPDSGEMTFANAGHPPPAVVTAGRTVFLEGGLTPPLGTTTAPSHLVATAQLDPGSTLVLFTDGLIERRGVSLHQGMEQLRQAAAAGFSDVDDLCDRLLASLAGHEVGDDIALLALQPLVLEGTAMHLQVPAEPRSLAPLRHTLRRWLRTIGASPDEGYEILVACGEACANAIQHPHAARRHFLTIDLATQGDDVEVVVRDTGSWRTMSPGGGGHGLSLIRQLMDSVDITTGPEGTEVRMRRRLNTQRADERARAR